MLVIRNYFGAPSPASGPALNIQAGDIIELLCADIHSPWWQVRDIINPAFNPSLSAELPASAPVSSHKSPFLYLKKNTAVSTRWCCKFQV